MEHMKTLQDLASSLESKGESKALSWKQGGDIVSHSYRELGRRVRDFSRGFLEMGLKPGDTVVLLSHNNPEWIGLSLGLNNAGLVDVPRGENTTSDEIKYFIEHSRAGVVIVQNKTFLKMVRDLDLPDLKTIISMEKIDGVRHTSEVLAAGKNSSVTVPEVTPATTASLIYTSGTTSLPKGVELTHGNFCSNIRSLVKFLPISTKDKFISILPAWHALERISKYMTLTVGAETFYSTWRTLRSDLLEQKPTIMVSVPRIWDMIYTRLMKRVKEQGGLSRRLFSVGMKVSIDYVRRRREFELVKLFEYPFYHYMDRHVFSRLRKRMGGRFRFAVSGGSSLPRHVDDFFRVAGVEILEGYGLTETSPVVALRVPGNTVPYTVGPVLEDIEARIIDQETEEVLPLMEKGVLHVRGPNIMKGYYRNPTETSRVLQGDGWFNTGDIGYFTRKGDLVITGRAKDIIVLSNGENINPVPMEDVLKESEYIAEAIMVGQEWKQPGALIVPDFDTLREYCDQNGISYHSDRLYDVFSNPNIKQLFTAEIDRLLNSQSWCKSYEKIQNFRMVYAPFTVGKELTPTLKPKRAVIEELYKELIESLWLSIHQKKR